MFQKKIIQDVLVDFQLGLCVTLMVKPLTWGHGPNSGLARNLGLDNVVSGIRIQINLGILLLLLLLLLF